MLYLVLAYLIISAICLWAGLVFYGIFHYFAGKTGNHNNLFKRPIACYLLSGLILITGMGQWIVLVFPLNSYALIFVVIPLLAFLSLLLKRYLAASIRDLLDWQNANPFFLPCFGIFLFMILTLNAGPVIMDDTESYHIQMVKWAREYGTVPGIANLHIRFGLNSSWFLSIALLMPEIKGVSFYMCLNGVVSCWLCHYLLSKIFDVFSGCETTFGTKTFSNVFYAAVLILIPALVAWPMLRGNATSANYDFISTFCIIVLFMETLSAERMDLNPELIIWPFYLSTVKLVSLPLLLICLFSLIRSFRKPILLTGIAAAFFFLTPFCIRSALLSGYLLFPVYQLDFFSFDWKASKTLIAEWVDFTKYFNRSGGDPERVAHLPFAGWIRIWHHNLVLYDKILTDFSLLCWLGILIRWKKIVEVFSVQYRLLISTLAITLIIWLIFSPDPRFFYGGLLAGIFTFLLTFQPLSSLLKSRRLIAFALLFISGCSFVYTVRKMAIDPEYRNWVSTWPLPVPTTKKLMVGGIELQIPDKVLDNWNPRCYGLPLPCLYKLNPLLRARGKNIRDGFRLNKVEHPGKLTGEYELE